MAERSETQNPHGVFLDVSLASSGIAGKSLNLQIAQSCSIFAKP